MALGLNARATTVLHTSGAALFPDATIKWLLEAGPTHVTGGVERQTPLLS